RPEEAEGLALLDAEADVVDDGPAAVPLGQSLYRDHAHDHEVGRGGARSASTVRARTPAERSMPRHDRPEALRRRTVARRARSVGRTGVRRASDLDLVAVVAQHRAGERLARLFEPLPLLAVEGRQVDEDEAAHPGLLGDPAGGGGRGVTGRLAGGLVDEEVRAFGESDDG